MLRLIKRLSCAARTQHGLFISLAGVTAGNIIFHILAGRALGPADYGSLSALLTILLGLAVPAGAVQVALTTRVVQLRQAGQEVDYRRIAIVFAGFGLFGAALITTASPVLATYLSLDGAVDIYLVGAFFVPTAVGIVFRSVLLGREEYGKLGASLVFGTGLRVGAGLLLHSYQAGITSALVGTLVSEIITTALLGWSCRTRVAPTVIPWRLSLTVTEVGGGISAFVGLWLLLGADTILARHHLDPADAGAYAATALAARTVLFLPQAAVTAALPKFAIRTAEATRHLLDTLLLCLVLGLAVMVGLLALAKPVGALVLGPAFPLDGGVLVMLAGGALWLALLSTFVNFHLAQGSIGIANRVWVGVVLLLVCAPLTTAEPQGLAITVLACGALASVMVTVPLLKADRNRLPRFGTGPAPSASLDLSVVVPFRNEGSKTAELIVDLLEDLDRSFDGDVEVIAICDGSTDHGDELVSKLDDARIVLISKPASEGKGAALRTGMTIANGSVIAMIDGDGDIAPGHLVPMVSELDLYQADAVIGSKKHPRSLSEPTIIRRLLSFASRLAAKLLLHSPIPDSQTGIKVFRRDLVVDALPRTQENGYLFDLELLLAARASGFSHLVETPVQIVSMNQSSIGPRATAASAITLLRLVGRFSGVRPASDSAQASLGLLNHPDAPQIAEATF